MVINSKKGMEGKNKSVNAKLRSILYYFLILLSFDDLDTNFLT